MKILRLLESWGRVVLCVLWTVVVGLPAVVIFYVRYLIGLVCAWFGHEEVLERKIDRNVQTFGLVTRDFWARGIFKLTRMTFVSAEESPIDWRRTHVICANHTSLFDVFALVSAVPVPVRFVAKRELVLWPIVGWALKPSGQILVDRRRQQKAIRSIAEAGKRDVRGQIVFFVEGTRSRSGDQLPFKKGAFHFALTNQLPLLPTAIGGAHRALARTAWWNLNPGSEIFVDFCAPIEVPRAWAEDDRDRLIDELLERTRSAISDALDRHPSDRSAG